MFKFLKRKKINKNKINTTNKENVIDVENAIYETNNRHLICDDSVTNRVILKRYIERLGIKCDDANNGAEIIENIQNGNLYDIIWLDIQMPLMNGYQTIEKLRNEYKYNGIVIGVTGYIDNTSVEKAIQLGMNYVVGKPIDKVKIRTFCEKFSKIQ